MSELTEFLADTQLLRAVKSQRRCEELEGKLGRPSHQNNKTARELHLRLKK